MRGTLKTIMEFLRQLKHKYIPNSKHIPDFSKSREINTPQGRDIKEGNYGISNVGSQIGNAGSQIEGNSGISNACSQIGNAGSQSEPLQPPEAGSTSEQSIPCPYCSSKDTVKRGLRSKKYEVQQRYLCNACNRAFVAPRAKGKSFPLKIILEAISYYNTGFTLAESCRFLKEKSGLDVKEASLSNWLRGPLNARARL